jgi:protein O-GlcNAc transferase
MVEGARRKTNVSTLDGHSSPARRSWALGAFAVFCRMIVCAGVLLSSQFTAQQPLHKPADLHFERGMQLLKQQSWKDAADEFRTALKIDPQRADAHMQLGRALIRLGEPESASAEFRQAIRIEPSNAQAHYCLGDTMRQRGDLENAVHALEAALRLRPAMREGYDSLGSTLKAFASARSASLRSLSHHPPDRARELDQQARTAVVGGEFSIAREKLMAALQIDPDYAETHNLLVLCLVSKLTLPEPLST